MTAQYPKAIRRFQPEDRAVPGELVMAHHVNGLQDEVESVERALGTDINVLKDPGAKIWYPSASGKTHTYVELTGAGGNHEFGSLNDRIANIEKAALRDLDSIYLSTSGGLVSGGLSLSLSSGAALRVTYDGGTTYSAEIDATGDIRARSISLTTGSSSLVLDPGAANPLSLGGFGVKGTGELSVGGTTIHPGDTGSRITVTAAGNSGTDTILVNNDAGLVRNVLRVVQNGATKFAIDTTGKISGSGLTIEQDLKALVLNGHQVMTDTNLQLYSAGKSAVSLGVTGLTLPSAHYKPSDLKLSGGATLSSSALTFPSAATVTATALSVNAPTTISSTLSLPGYTTQLYRITDKLWVHVPSQPAHGVNVTVGDWDIPYSASTGTGKRDLRLDFVAPASGTVKVDLTCVIFAMSRPVWLTFAVYDKTSGAQVTAPSDIWSVMHNGASAQQTDISEVRVANFTFLTGLTPGKTYQLRPRTRAGSYVDTARMSCGGVTFAIEPVITRLTSQWVT